MSNDKNSKKTAYNRGRGKKPFEKRAPKQKGNRTDDSIRYDDTRVCAGSKDNDPSWYALNPQLLRDAASFPYAWPLGNRLNLGKFASRINKGSVPGIMAMNWVPTIGYSSNGTSPANVASINTYTKVRHDNSGHANYDHADYMMYLLAMDSVYAFHSWMRRLYGVMLTYSNTNRYYPRAVVKAMGVDFDSLQKNLADFRQYVNTYAVKASALAVPANMSIMTKHYWMSEGLYYDSNQDKPQTYLFNPIGFYKFSLTSDATPHGTLKFVPFFPRYNEGNLVDALTGAEASNESKAWTLNDIVQYGDALLAPIISDEDFGIMSGDTLKSFGVGGCYTLPFTEETYTVVPSYSGEVLDQIQNATFIGMPAVNSLTIDQDISVGAGWILTDPKFTHPWLLPTDGNELPGQNAFLVNRFLTFEHGDITPEQTMEASRWTNISVEVTESNTREYRVPTMGTEVMCVGNIGWFHQESENAPFDITFSDNIYVSMDAAANGSIVIDATQPEKVPTQLAALAQDINAAYSKIHLLTQMLSVFDRHPAVYLSGFIGGTTRLSAYAQNSATPTQSSGMYANYSTINGVLFDVNYYTVLDSSDLEEMSHIALLSEFDVTTRK